MFGTLLFINQETGYNLNVQPKGTGRVYTPKKLEAGTRTGIWTPIFKKKMLFI